jgi:hypothetical protein
MKGKTMRVIYLVNDRNGRTFAAFTDQDSAQAMVDSGEYPGSKVVSFAVDVFDPQGRLNVAE